jgi:signal transduction histidine kinase
VSASPAKILPDAAVTLRTPLERLLHALNQPLTGLQCSLEVALAAPRTVEYYQQRLREGIDLAERMRALVEAIREVAEGETGSAGVAASTNSGAVARTVVRPLLREVVEGLEPVAEAKKVRIVIENPAAFPLAIDMNRQRISSLLFRIIESALTLAERESEVRIEVRSEVRTEARIETGGCNAAGPNAPAEALITIRWQGARAPEFSRPELGLLVAQAGWEGAGAKWARERTGNLESVTVSFEEVLEGHKL